MIGTNLLLALRISSGPALCNSARNYPKKEMIYMKFATFYAKSGLLPIQVLLGVLIILLFESWIANNYRNHY